MREKGYSKLAKILKGTVLISLFLLMLAGCTSLFESERLRPETKFDEGQVTLTPVDVFAGDAAKFKHFFGLTTVGFKLHYEGEVPDAHLDVHIWKDGKEDTSVMSIHDLFRGTDESKEVEVIISIDSITLQDHDPLKSIKIGITQDSGSTLSTTTMASWDEQMTLSGTSSHHEPVVFNTDETAYLWAMTATSKNQLRTGDFSPGSLQEMERGLVFTLRFDDE